MAEDSYRALREDMVDRQIKARGVTNPLVLEAMRTVPRHAFVPEDQRSMAYEDRPLPIGSGQTISQPYIVAYMTQLLRLGGGEKVLEVGTGHGYQAAVLSRIASHVYTVECHSELAEQAGSNLRQLGYDNVSIRVGDGTVGWPEEAPFGGILATASGPDVPEPLKEQLAFGGRLVMPIGAYRLGQSVVRVLRGADGAFHQERMLDVAFVPLIGKHGWQE